MWNKVMQINTSVNTGSTGRIAEEIGVKVIASGFDSYIAYGGVARESKSHLIRIGGSIDFKIHALSTRLFDNHGFCSKNATKMFIKELEEIKPNIIHFHNLHGYYLNVKVLFDYLKNVQIPVVWTLHDCWPMTGHCSYFDFVNCSCWETECHLCPNLKGYPATWFFDHSKRNFHRKKEVFTSLPNITFVTPSLWLKNIVTRSFFKNYPVKVIHNGTNLSVFRPVDSQGVRMKYGIKETDKLILGVASVWDKRKGLMDFIRLSDLLNQNELIVLVGLNHKQQKRLPNNIIAIQRTEDVHELAALYSLADVFVNPTWVDNFPTTNIEALACGTPVVTYRTGGSPEAISQSTGIIVEKGDINALYCAVSNIIRVGKTVYGNSCRERAIALFNKEDRFQDYIELYKTLL